MEIQSSQSKHLCNNLTFLRRNENIVSCRLFLSPLHISIPITSLYSTYLGDASMCLATYDATHSIKEPFAYENVFTLFDACIN
jgi:hypothetical protein